MKKIYLFSIIITLLISGCTQPPALKYGCFSCEEMPKQLDSAKLFLNWYNKISNNNISSENVNCIEICNTSYGYNKVTFDFNGKNFTIGGTGYIDSEEQVAQSDWWFKHDNSCLTVGECTGVEFAYGANYSHCKEAGLRGTCVNKYWISYRSEDATISIKGNFAGCGIENWTVTGTMEHPISGGGLSKEPIIWGTYNCSCAKALLSEEKVCGMGMRIT